MQPYKSKHLRRSASVPSPRPGSRWQRVSFKPESIPEIPACYVLLSGKRVLYVGSAVKLFTRLVHGHKLQDGSIGYRNGICDPQSLTVAYRPSVKFGDWAMVEIRLIRRLRPLINGTSRFSL